MNRNDSDWLNDTLPAEENSNNSQTTSSNKENTSNDTVDTANDIEEIENSKTQAEVTYEKPENVSIPTINNVMDKIDVNQTDDDKYLEEFIGKNYEKISTKMLNFGALFFSYFYLFYRKMYLLGLLILIIQTSIIVYVNPYVSLIINVILFFLTNIIYTAHAKRKIKRIKNKSGSKLRENLVNECAAAGGTSKKAVFIAIALEIVIVIYVSFQFRDKEPYSDIANFIDNHIEDIKYEIDNLINNN